MSKSRPFDLEFRPTLGRLWGDFGRLWADSGPIMGRLWDDFGPTLGRLSAYFGSTWGPLWVFQANYGLTENVEMFFLLSGIGPSSDRIWANFWPSLGRRHPTLAWRSHPTFVG